MLSGHDPHHNTQPQLCSYTIMQQPSDTFYAFDAWVKQCAYAVQHTIQFWVHSGCQLISRKLLHAVNFLDAGTLRLVPINSQEAVNLLEPSEFPRCKTLSLTYLSIQSGHDKVV